ncbi:MAG: ABC transporter ATP-binding protein [Bacilli bacterium]
MDEQETKVNLTDKKIIKRLLNYAKNHKKAFAISVLLMIFAVGIDLVLPILIGTASKILGSDVIKFDQIIGIVTIYGVLLIIMFIIQFYQAMTLQKAGQKIIYEVREQVFTHIEKYSIAQINHIPVGKLVTRVTNDTNTLNEMYTSVIINLLKDSFTIIGVLVAMFFVDVTLSLYVLAICPIIVLISFIFRKYSREAYREVRSNVANVNAFLSENISGMKVTQVFNQEKKKLNEFQEKNNQLKKSSLKEIFIFGIFRPAIYVLYIATVILVLWFGSNNVILQAGLTFEIIIIFHQYIDRLFNPIQQLAEQFNILQSAFAASEKIFEVLDKQPEIVDEPDAVELTDVKGEIEFKNVWFSYLPDEWILKDVSFKIQANETVAFVGATGSGKTTILSLIVRNYDIQKGQILIDGIDIRKIKIASLRSQIGQMLQDVFLFSGTIASNIRMREDKITDDDVRQACEYVNADKFIASLPNGYQEEVRERGNNFSSGQRQLLSFARTMAHKPKVMILDEATANIDTETEVLIQDSLQKMMNVGTMLVVAHRLSTIQHADKIIVLQKGVIIEEGNHQTLLKKRGQYYKLYKLQYQNK